MNTEVILERHTYMSFSKLDFILISRLNPVKLPFLWGGSRSKMVKYGQFHVDQHKYTVINKFHFHQLDDI